MDEQQIKMLMEVLEKLVESLEKIDRRLGDIAESIIERPNS